MKSAFFCVLAAGGLLFLGACSGDTGDANRAAAAPSRARESNGQMIFLTGKNGAGHPITAAKAPLAASCAACHHANGAGGLTFPGGAVSADLRHGALVTKQKHPYTLALLERAIAKGIDNENTPLDAVMPRWKLSPRDLHDVAAYVMTLK